VDEIQGEMNKIKPPTFDGEHRKDEDADTWLLGMRKYFQLHNYSSHAKGSVDFNLVQYFTASIFSIKEQKRYNGKYTHYTEIFPMETQTEKTNIFYIHS
jgi:hypothetical protein